MSVHHLLSTEAAYVMAQPAATGAVTAGRLWSLVAGLLGLAGVAVGVLAVVRPAGRLGDRGAVVALAAGLLAAVVGGLVVAAADGGPGTGYGIVGGYVALVIGLIAMVIGGWALSRSRRTAAPADAAAHEHGRR